MIGDKKLSNAEIDVLYDNDAIDRSVFLLLHALNNDYVRDYLHGYYPIRYDSSVPQESYFTNVEAVLCSFYEVFENYPAYEVEKVLPEQLMKFALKGYTNYYAVEYLVQQIKFEQAGKAAFTFDKNPILEKIRENTLNNEENTKKNKLYKGEYYQDCL